MLWLQKKTLAAREKVCCIVQQALRLGWAMQWVGVISSFVISLNQREAESRSRSLRKRHPPVPISLLLSWGSIGSLHCSAGTHVVTPVSRGESKRLQTATTTMKTSHTLLLTLVLLYINASTEWPMHTVCKEDNLEIHYKSCGKIPKISIFLPAGQ